MGHCTSWKNTRRHTSTDQRWSYQGHRKLLFEELGLGSPSAHTALPARSLPKITCTPSTGNRHRTPTATSPSTRPHVKVIWRKGEENGTRPIPCTRTQSPVPDIWENGNADSKIKESEVPVPLKRQDLTCGWKELPLMTRGCNGCCHYSRAKVAWPSGIKSGTLSSSDPPLDNIYRYFGPLGPPWPTWHQQWHCADQSNFCVSAHIHLQGLLLQMEMLPTDFQLSWDR